MSEDSKWDGFYFDQEKFSKMITDNGFSSEEAKKICFCIMESHGLPFKVFPKEVDIVCDEMPVAKIKIKNIQGGPLYPCCFEAMIGDIPSEFVRSIKIPELADDKNMNLFSMDVKFAFRTQSQIDGIKDLKRILKKVSKKHKTS